MRRRLRLKVVIPEKAGAVNGKYKRLSPVFTDADKTPKSDTPGVKPMTVPKGQNREQVQKTQPPVLNIPKTERPVMRFSGMSIRQMLETPKTQTTVIQPEGKKNMSDTQKLPDISTTDLIVAWRTFAQNMPHEEKAMSQRMDQLEPKMVNKDEFEVQVENPTILDMMKGLMHRIIPSMRSQLSHPTLTMKIVMRDLSDIPRVLSKQDQIRLIREQSPAFVRLEKEFALVL